MRHALPASRTWVASTNTNVRQLNSTIFNSREENVVVHDRDFLDAVLEGFRVAHLLSRKISHVDVMIRCAGDNLALVVEETSGKDVSCVGSLYRSDRTHHVSY